MNQNQRKYAAERIRNVAAAKSAELKREFEANPDNVKRPVPNALYPLYIEVLKALAGMPSQAILKPRAEVEAFLNNNVNSYSYHINSLVQCTNQAEVDAAKAYNDVIDARYQAEVAQRQERINNSARTALDSIMLGGNEEALAAIAAFEAQAF